MRSISAKAPETEVPPHMRARRTRERSGVATRGLRAAPPQLLRGVEFQVNRRRADQRAARYGECGITRGCTRRNAPLPCLVWSPSLILPRSTGLLRFAGEPQTVRPNWVRVCPSASTPMPTHPSASGAKRSIRWISVQRCTSHPITRIGRASRCFGERSPVRFERRVSHIRTACGACRRGELYAHLACRCTSSGCCRNSSRRPTPSVSYSAGATQRPPRDTAVTSRTRPGSRLAHRHGPLRRTSMTGESA